MKIYIRLFSPNMNWSLIFDVLLSDFTLLCLRSMEMKVKLAFYEKSRLHGGFLTLQISQENQILNIQNVCFHRNQKKLHINCCHHLLFSENKKATKFSFHFLIFIINNKVLKSIKQQMKIYLVAFFSHSR